MAFVLSLFQILKHCFKNALYSLHHADYVHLMESAQEILVQEYKKRKARNANFSLRSFAKWLGMSPAQLSQMMTGKRPITLKSGKKIGERLGLSPLEKRGLSDSILKERRLLDTPKSENFLRLQEDQFRLIADWYHLAILSLTKVKSAVANPMFIARRLGISIDEAHQALLRLQRMGIIQTKPDFQQTSDPFEVLSEVPSEAIQKYHKQNLALAMEKIETVPLPYRQFQSISFALNPKHLPELKKHIDNFLAQALESADREPKTEVYHLNVQLFPVTIIKQESAK